MTTSRDVRDATLRAIEDIQWADVEALGRAIERCDRVFTVGNGGSAAHASHCACDLTKLARKSTICLNDNLASYSAGVNDERRMVYARMLERFGFRERGEDWDLLIVFSVGGGDLTKGVSEDLVHAAKYAMGHGNVAAVLGRKGDLYEYAHHTVLIQSPVPELITPVVESVMPLVWHALVAGPLKREEPVWR